MKHLQNLHTHSVYCDGADTPEVLIRTAMEKGFESLGFSGHSPMWYSPYKTVTVEKTEAYKQKISQLKEEYKTREEIAKVLLSRCNELGKMTFEEKTETKEDSKQQEKQ